MQYMLLIQASEAGFAKLPPDHMAQAMAAYGAYTEAIKKSGVVISSERLRPSADTTVVRVANGKTQVLNGPYAESQEQLGGYYLIDVPSLDEAIAWAARCPGASHGAIEIRPIWPN